MTDVFISYATSDRERARELAHALSARGWSVWWDRNIKAGQNFDEVIERELESAKNIVVLWSVASVASEWVKNEAAVAAQRRVLVPVLLDNVKIPLEFRRKQTADLVGWDGDRSHRGLQALYDALEGTPLEPATAAAFPAPLKRVWRLRPWMAAGGTGLVLGCVLSYLVLGGLANREENAASTRDAAAGTVSSMPTAGATRQTTKGSLPVNIPTAYKGVVADVTGFEKTGELTTVEWLFKSSSDVDVTICAYPAQAKLMDQISGESWPALHSGGAVVRCERLRAGEKLGAWAKFKVPGSEDRHFSMSMPGVNKAPELPRSQVSSR